MEEKIIERADRKLFLDAAVIQQGRLAEQNSKLSKDDLMKMVKFGADQILSGSNGTYTDEDIDALIAKGEQKTSLIQAKLKTDAQHNLATFSLLGEDETGKDTFEFGGENYRNKAANIGTFINLPQRERKRNYNVNEYFRESMQEKRPEPKKRKKSHIYYDFQLFNKPRLEYFENRERALSMKKAQREEEIAELRGRAKAAPSLQNARLDLRMGSSREELNARADEIEKSLTEFELSQGQCKNNLFDLISNHRALIILFTLFFRGRNGKKEIAFRGICRLDKERFPNLLHKVSNECTTITLICCIG